ncbi:EF-hand domain-containing protein [Bradyrhizobium sp.]|uniref:EF-hand domain-containing protein n=1 Tax=Bradyrhizobium sp. TaxID=376 RepID=UPI002D76D894|nr:EF-hand domain-containing protein [Bradyrhizobium sp.]
MRKGISRLRIGVTLAMLLAGNSLGVSLARAEDPMLNSSPAWDANHDGVYTCEEWKSFMDRLFVSADKGRKGFLTRQEFDAVKKADPALAQADFGYFDENQDGKISRKEFVDKPSVFIVRFDRNGDCKVTPDELKAASSPQSTGAPQERPRDRFH